MIKSSIVVRFTVKALLCLYVLVSFLFLASCEAESPVSFFSGSGANAHSAPLVALSSEAAKGFVQGSGCFLFAFPPELAGFSDSQALEVAIEVTAADESSSLPSADIKLAFLTEDDFIRLPSEGRPKLNNAVRELRNYGKRQGESFDEAVAISAGWASLLECAGGVSIRISAPLLAPAAGFALLVSAPDTATTSVVSASKKEVSCGWLSEAEDGRVSWAGFPPEGGSTSSILDPASLPSVHVPETHSISFLFKACPAEDAAQAGRGSASSLSARQRRAVFRSRASSKEFGARLSPSGGISIFQPPLLKEGLGEVASVSGGECLKGVFTSPAFPESSGNAASNSELLVFPELEPVAADPHGIIEWPQSAWRRPEREIFKWDRFPSIIVFDTADYDIQNRYFRRLAFFAEKQGYRGTLLTDAELSRMHGFNAHDYSAESLAAFFSQAALSGFELSDEELELRGILLNSGIIRSSGDGAFIPGNGAVVSISRSSPLYLRYSLMAHEGFHALYFIDEDFREKVHEVYSSIDPRARSFLQEYFRVVDGLGYDISDTRLMENEFMGYVLQNRIDFVQNYFSVNIAERYLRYGGNPALAVYVMESEAADFVRAAEELSAYTFSRWGILGGRVGLQFWDD